MFSVIAKAVVLSSDFLLDVSNGNGAVTNVADGCSNAEQEKERRKKVLSCCFRRKLRLTIEFLMRAREKRGRNTQPSSVC